MNRSLIVLAAMLCSINVAQVKSATDAPPVRELIGHVNTPESVSFSPDGKLLASCGLDGFIIIWDVATGKKLRVLRNPVHLQVNGVAFSSDGAYLAATMFGTESLIVYSVGTGEVVNSVKEGMAWHIVYSSDGKLLITSGFNDKLVKIWDANSLELKRTLGAGGNVSAFALSPDNKTLASVCPPQAMDGDNPVILWDVETGNVKGSAAMRGYVRQLAFSRNGKWLAATRSSGRQEEIAVSLFDAQFGSLVRTFSGHRSGVAIAFSPNSATLAVGGDNMKNEGEIAIYNTDSGAMAKQWHIVSEYLHTQIATMAFSPDGKLLATAGRDPVVRIWDLHGADK